VEGAELDVARSLVRDAARVTVLTGAGISTASGIPDFRGPEGVWTKDPAAEMLSTYERYVRDADVRKAAWRSRVTRRFNVPEPNDGHRALLALERRGTLVLLVTQNIDGLHLRAGSDPARLVEIHGSARDSLCLTCGHRQAIELTYPRVLAGDEDPACLEIRTGAACGGILKSAVISFGQSLVAADLARAEDASENCDALLCVGSTLSVFPAAGMVPMAHRAGAAIVIVNAQPTAMDDLATVHVGGDITEVLPALLA
jgi:NAD-dependent deacetylase